MTNFKNVPKFFNLNNQGCSDNDFDMKTVNCFDTLGQKLRTKCSQHSLIRTFRGPDNVRIIGRILSGSVVHGTETFDRIIGMLTVHLNVSSCSKKGHLKSSPYFFVWNFDTKHSGL